MNTIPALKQRPQPASAPCLSTAFGCPRDFLDNRFVYTVVSPRARGLSVGVNMNPDRRCNFDCVYCEVDRSEPAPEASLDVGAMILELERTLEAVHSGRIRERPGYQRLPADLLQLRHVALSGDGEPTLCPNFLEAVEAVIHLRARGWFPFFKLVLMTNASGFDIPAVEQGLRLFTPRDEVWAKFEAGTPDYLERVNQADRTMEQTLASILNLARRRPVIIQSLFPAIHGAGPPLSEIEAYARRLKELKDAGAQIPLVQIYSATRPTPHSECGHLPLKTLSGIARRVEEVAGLKAEVF
jgi:wyosine [tRNA(Phe)-imidazoG37] synthetase (radical SAM superfamily)